MKITDLMVKDWVEVTQNSEKHFAQVQMIDGYGDNATSNECVCDAIYYSIDELNPIPLTAEILISNGFESRNNNHFYFDDEYTEFDIHELTDSIWFVECEDLEFSMPSQRMIVCNVHELQHALRLCGINKEIQL